MSKRSRRLSSDGAPVYHECPACCWLSPLFALMNNHYVAAVAKERLT